MASATAFFRYGTPLHDMVNMELGKFPWVIVYALACDFNVVIGNVLTFLQ